MRRTAAIQNVPALVVAGLLGAVAVAALAQGSDGPKQRRPLTIAKVMTAEQLKNTGVADLTLDQRRALDQWLNEYTARVIEVALKPRDKAKAYAGVGKGHWVRKTIDGGKLIILEDGSLWEVSALDRINTALWLATTDITVIEARAPIGDFKYVLINTDDGETAKVKYLGKR